MSYSRAIALLNNFDKMKFLILISSILLCFSVTTLKADAVGNSDPLETDRSDLGCDWWDSANNTDELRQEAKDRCILALFALGEEKWQKTKTYLDRAIQIDSNYPESYLLRSVVYLKLQQPNLAIADLNRAIEIAPNYVEPYQIRAIYYMSQKQWQKALADFNRIIEIEPNDANSYIARSAYYNVRQKHDKMLADFERAIEVDPDNTSTYLQRGNYYRYQQQWNKALADYTKAIEIDDSKPAVYLNRSVVYGNLQQWNKALADVNRAIELNPNLISAYLNRSSIYIRTKQWDKALADANRAIKLNPDSAKAYVNRSSVYIETERWDKATVDLQKALQLDPELADAYKLRGYLDHLKNDYSAAISNYQRAISFVRNNSKININLAPLFNNIGLIKYEMDATDEAIQNFKAAIKHDSKLTESKFALATILYAEGKTDRALELAKQSLMTNKKYANIQYLKNNLWGEKIIDKAEKLLSEPALNKFTSTLQSIS